MTGWAPETGEDWVKAVDKRSRESYGPRRGPASVVDAAERDDTFGVPDADRSTAWAAAGLQVHRRDRGYTEQYMAPPVVEAAGWFPVFGALANARGYAGATQDFQTDPVPVTLAQRTARGGLAWVGNEVVVEQAGLYEITGRLPLEATIASGNVFLNMAINGSPSTDPAVGIQDTGVIDVVAPGGAVQTLAFTRKARLTVGTRIGLSARAQRGGRSVAAGIIVAELNVTYLSPA